uniref:Serpentine receptor class gamma n=1 Tax=Globodera pallida TaxID=36090 RepID=A0A183BXR4_GLOPA
MGILEWLISARDPFIYFAMCLSIPSMALYIAQIVTIIRHKQFHNSFYSLFIIRAIPDMLYVLDSFYCYRLPILFGSVLYPIYSMLPNWMIGLAFFLTGYSFQANNLATAFILLNRLTAIAVPLKHKKLWQKFLPLVAIVVFCVPICTNWVMFKSEGILQKENPNSTDQSFSFSEAGEAPFSNYLIYLDATFSVIFMAFCILINICVFVTYKSKAKNGSRNNSDRIEQKLLVYALVTFFGHALMAFLMIGISISVITHNSTMSAALVTHYPWVFDTCSVASSSWLLLWAGDSFRQQLLKDYRISRICCKTPANNRVETIKMSNKNNCWANKVADAQQKNTI